MAKVYVSSTRRDLEQERERVIDWLVKAGHQPVHSYTPDGRTVRESCLDDVAGCDVFVLILGYRYGFQPEEDNPQQLSITHLEFRQAREEGLPVVALVRTDVPRAEDSDLGDPELLAKVQSFHAEVRRAVRPGQFVDNADLLAELSTGVPRALERVGGESGLSLSQLRERFALASTDLLSWPTTLPGGEWLARPEQDELLRRVSEELHSATLLLGEPGSGKSALLARIGGELQGQGLPVLAIKADLLPETLADADELARYQGLSDVVLNVRRLARETHVVVLVDQLDALAEMVVQRAGRLRVLLSLVRQLTGVDGVHVIASCRVFEQRHDPRLRNLDTEVLTLELPAWELVDTVLGEQGVHTGRWNEGMRADLRYPHALETFLRHLDASDELHLLQSYQAMLRALWKRDVLSDETGRRRALLLSMAARMAEREVLWLPLATFDDRRGVVGELEAVGLLVVKEGADRVGFRHQTLYEFVRARAFLDAEGALSDTVLARQESLRIRPQLWHALGYLRDADRAAYLVELRRLWAADLRPHLRMLLIEFLGQVSDPEGGEQRLVTEAFNEFWCRRRLLAAMAGSAGWFPLLRRSLLPQVMPLAESEAWTAVAVLARASAFAPKDVLALVDAFWLPDAGKDGLTWRVLETFECWEQALVDRCCRILARTDVSAWQVGHLASVISMQLPEEAPRLIAAWLNREWERGPLRPENAQQEGRTDTGEQERHRLSLLEGRNLHDLPAIAEAEPAAFLDCIWLWFRRGIESITGEPHPFVVGFRSEQSLLWDMDDDEQFQSEGPMLVAIAEAVKCLAKTRAEKFLEFAAENEGEDQQSVQRLLAKGMVHIAASHPYLVLEFLCADPRRLVLGSPGNCHQNSQQVIKALAPHLSQAQFARLAGTVLRWERYYGEPPDDDAGVRLRRLRWNREHRLRLLRALPRERMCDKLRRTVKEEERAFPTLPDYDFLMTGFHAVCSPVSTEQMEKASDENILNLFEDLTDTHQRDRFGEPGRGGVVEAARELGKLAETDPDRALRLMRRLRPADNEIPVAEAFAGLVKSSVDRRALFEIVEEFVERGFASDRFRREAADAIKQSVSAERPLSEHLFEVLESWLMPVDGTQSGEPDAVRRDHDDSLLWGRGLGFYTVPDGNYPVLSALSVACLVHETPLTGRWLDILERHLARGESSHVWSVLGRELGWLRLADHDRAQAFLDALFSSHPEVLNSIFGVQLFAHCQTWAGPAWVQGWLRRLPELGEVAAQGAGELLVMRHLLFPGESEIGERIDSYVAARSEETVVSVRLGIAHAVAYCWSEPLYRARVHPLLMAFISDENERILDALTRVFERDSLIPDRETRELLQRLCDERAVLHRDGASALAEQLEELVELEPELVARVAGAMLDESGAAIADPASIWNWRSEFIVAVAFALQDHEREEYRTMGTVLFERALEVDVPYARELTLGLDKRTPNDGTPGAAVRRRRWRRRRPHGRADVG